MSTAFLVKDLRERIRELEAQLAAQSEALRLAGEAKDKQVAAIQAACEALSRFTCFALLQGDLRLCLMSMTGKSLSDADEAFVAEYGVIREDCSAALAKLREVQK